MGCRQEVNVIMKLTRHRAPLNVSLDFLWKLLNGIKTLRSRLEAQSRRPCPVSRPNITAIFDNSPRHSPSPEKEARRPILSLRERRRLIKLAAKIRRKEWRSCRKSPKRQLPLDVTASPTSTSEPVVSPASSADSSVQGELSRSSSGGRPLNPIPRHKRQSHIKAEYKRRSKIQTGFDTLKSLVPNSSESDTTKESKASMLFKAADYCRQLKDEHRSLREEEQRLQLEIQQLHADIDTQQQMLPEGGLSVVQRPTCSGEPAFKEYLKSQTSQNWRFWLFSFIARPLFESYSSMVSTTSSNVFFQTIMQWADQHLSLINLRPIGIETLRQISIQSSIMTDPEKLPQEAQEKMSK